MESQAGFIEYLWLWGRQVDKNGNTKTSGEGSFFTAKQKSLLGEFEAYGINFTDIANKAINTIRKSLM